MKKTMKFRDVLADLVLAGEKTSTWRLFDDKDLQAGEEVEFINWNTGEKFAEAVLVSVREKQLGTLEPADFEGHEKFESAQAMYDAYRTYYGREVGPETAVKIIQFELKQDSDPGLNLSILSQI
jgi:hypothetical protein